MLLGDSPLTIAIVVSSLTFRGERTDEVLEVSTPRERVFEHGLARSARPIRVERQCR
jgi:hypothetical protein